MINQRECLDCGCLYSPVVREGGGRQPRGYKKCPECKSENTEERN